MTIEEYDQNMRLVAAMKRFGEDLVSRAKAMEADVEKLAGLEYHDRDPGFPCWTIAGLPGYHNTPREAVAAKEKVVAAVIGLK